MHADLEARYQIEIRTRFPSPLYIPSQCCANDSGEKESSCE